MATSFYSDSIKDSDKANERSNSLKVMIREYFQCKDVREVKIDNPIDVSLKTNKMHITP